MTALIEKLQWRYATKKFDPAKVVAQEKLDHIIEAVRLTATSSGLQPFELIVITNKELKENIKLIANNQSQITDCSHLLIFAAWDDITAERINMMFDLTNRERGFTNEGWESYRKFMIEKHTAMDADLNFQQTARQAYIGLGSALIAAAFEEVDSTPMEGFDPEALDRLLGLREKNLRSVALLPIGYREEGGDWLADLKKVRRSREHFVSEIA